MDWIPVVFISFKLLILGTALFFSIKTHREKAMEEQEEERQRQARASGAGGTVQVGQSQRRVEASQCAGQSGPG